MRQRLKLLLSPDCNLSNNMFELNYKYLYWYMWNSDPCRQIVLL